MTIDDRLTLNNKARIPYLGLGVWQIPDGDPTVNAVASALKLGYRHIDTAKYYRNEASVGAAIKHSGIKREDIWVTTKLWGSDQLRVEKAFRDSLSRLDLEYVDLYLVHFPLPGMVKRTWKAMEELYQTGKVRAIGVSNHSVGQLQDILSVANIPPAINQVKCSPYHFNKELYKFCQEEGIAFEAYSPLTRGEHLDDTALLSIAKRYKKTPAQILIRWCLQKGMVVIPKSANPKRQKENASVFDFEISSEDMNLLDNFS